MRCLLELPIKRGLAEVSVFYNNWQPDAIVGTNLEIDPASLEGAAGIRVFAHSLVASRGIQDWAAHECSDGGADID